MNIKLGNCRVIKADDMNLAVEQYKLVPQSKNPKLRHEGEKYRWTHVGWYQNLHQALKKIVDCELNESGASDVSQIMQKISDLHEEIEKLEPIKV